MILQALCGYYDRLAESEDSAVAPPGWAVTPVSTCITLDTDGNVVNVLSLVDEKRPRNLATPQQPKRSSGISPAFMCDNGGYFFALDEKRGTQKRDASAQLHGEILGEIDDVGATAVLRFFEQPIPDNADGFASGNIVFRLEGDADYIHNRPAIKAAWERYNDASAEGSETGQCLVTGEIAPIARLHGNLGGFGQDKPTVVGFNQRSFESYNKSQGSNAPVSEKAMFQYTTALNALIADPKHIVRMADTKVVFWAERDADDEEEFVGAALGGRALDPTSAQRIQQLLLSYKNGSLRSSDFKSDVTFHILGISAAKTRLVVRFFHSDTFGNLLTRIGQHYSDIEIVGASWDMDKLVKPFSILLETAVARKSDNIPPTLEGALIRSILDGSPYPHNLYNAVLTRVRADKNVNHVRAGVIKGFLNRSARHNNKKETMTVALNLEETNQGYLLGRLFAVLEKAQYDALGNVNATIVDKYLNSALATPQTVFPVLLPLFEKHVSKSEKYYSKIQVQQILGELPTSGFPQTLNAEDQGRFLIGYYHQRQDFYKGKPESDDNNNVTEGNEDV